MSMPLAFDDLDFSFAASRFLDFYTLFEWMPYYASRNSRIGTESVTTKLHTNWRKKPSSIFVYNTHH